MPLTKPPIQLPRGEPRQASGPDASGLNLPWPLTTALEQARSQALSPLAEYEAAHPEAQLAAAALTESTNGHYRQRTWTVQFVGAQSFGLAIHLDETEDGEPPMTSLFYSRNPQAAVNGDFYLQVIDPDPDLAPLANLPTQLPSVAEALAVYEAFRPSNDPEWDANAWSFAITCPAPCEGVAQAWISAGLYSEFSDEVGPTQRFGVEPLSEMRTHILMAASQVGQLAFVDQTDAVRKPYDHLPPTNPAEAPAWTIASRSEGYAWSNPQPLAALSTGLALVVAAIALLAHALRHGSLGLFTRIAPHALANHPTRAAILDVVNMSPGIHFSRLARQVDLAPGALQHHVSKLVEAGLVTKLARTGRTHYFPAGTTQQSAAQAATASIPGAAEILAAIRIHAGLSVSDLASQTGRTVGTVSHHLNHLEREGLIERRRMGRKVAVYPCF